MACDNKGSNAVALCLWTAIVCFVSCLDFVAANSLKDPYICGPPACIPSGKFKYNPNIIYHYDYHVDINTWFSGSSNNQSTLDIKISISLEFLTACEGLLRLNSVSMIDQDENFPEERGHTFAKLLTQYSVRFAFHEGVIMEICPHEGEEDWVLNFKRSILSLFQNSMKRFDIDFKGTEKDIHGTCDAVYNVRGQENTSLVIVKSRELTDCMDRYKYLSILQTVRYNFQSKYQTWPVLKSESKCRISVDHYVYKTVNCRERHLFEPFSGKQSGAMTTVIQDLALTKEVNKTDLEIMEQKSQEWEAIKLRTNLLHQHSAFVNPATGELKSARDVLKLLCRIDETVSDTDPESEAHMADQLDGGSIVGLWGSLVRACRGLHHVALSQLLARASSICPRAKKHVLDALPYIASIGSVQLIKDMIIKNTANEETTEEWLMSMAMIPRPKKEMIISMSELLKHSPSDRLITFTVSSMVHSYCKHSAQSLPECCREQQNQDIINIFHNNVITIIGDGMSNLTRDLKEKVTVSIKALGNVGGFSKDVEDLLIKIIDNSNMPTSVRLTAIDAFRKTPCIETREYFLHLFREDFVDIEVRLASYLQVMRCPNLATIRKILHALRHESVHQAASFVWSHLNNLGKSSIPSRVEIQGLLSGNNIPEPSHKPDFRKFSKNYEQSVFFDQYNAGGNYEANVIFSPDSYIPRSVSLNLTVDMFGESINILEVRARGEGFEKYFQSIFGAEGPLSQSIVEEKLESLRMFRSINKAEGVRSKIDSLGYKNDALNHQFPLADLGIKVFGNEISYWNAEGDGEIRSSLKKLNPLYYINKILSGKEISYKKASLFLDTTYVIPTGCGLPLTMNLMGTSYVNLKMAGSIAGAENFFTTKILDFEGKVHPSIALNIAATMGVRAGRLSSTGIRLNMRLYTSTAVETKLKLRGTSLVHLDLSLPHNKEEIFGAKSELIILHGEKENHQMGLNKNRIQAATCSWTTVDKAIGIKICAAYQFPNMTNLHNAPYFLMSGPAQYLVSLEKVDPTAKKYSFKYDWKSNETADIISFSFDTPGSKTKRMFNASISSLQDSGMASMIFQSAENTLKAHATYKNLPGDKYLESVLDIDGQKHFDAVMSLKKQPQKNGYIYIPKLYLAVNNERITELAGTLRVAQKKGVSQCDVSLEFQTKRLASRLIGYITWNGPSKGARLRLDYKFLNERKESIKIDALLSNRASGSRYSLYGELGLEFTSYPHLNFFTDVKYVSSSGHIESSLNLSSSRQMRDENSTLQFDFALHKKLDGLKLLSNLALHRPEINFLLSFEEAGAQYSALARISYEEAARDMELAGQLYWPPGAMLYVDGNVNITLPAMHPFSAQVVVHEKRAHEFDIRTTCIWFTGLDVTIAALYQDQSTTHMAAHHLKALITSSEFKDVSGNVRFTQDNRQTNFLIEGDYDKEKYGVLVRYVLYSDQNFTVYGQVDVKSKIYSLNLIIDLNNNTNLVADLHIDQVRDIHFTYLRSTTPKLKRLSAVLNWDANRDPSQKLSVDMQLQTKGTWSYGGALTLYYPGRIVSGEFDFLLRDWFCQWLVKIGWSPEDIILWKVKMYSEVQKETIYALLSEMSTPFQGWKETSFNLMWRYQDNLQALNGSMTWQKDYLTFGLLGDYLFKTNEFYGEINANVNSTIAALPRAAAIARHKHTWKKSADTLLSFQYNNDGVMMVNSSWQLDRNSNENNISGRVALMTPFPGYKNGLLRTRFVFSNNNRQVKGVTHLELEEKIFTITVDGYMRRITNSMLIINVSSPIAAYAHIQGRFGFVEAERHLIAMVIAPNSTTGIEIRLRLMSTQDFHIFGHLALPIQFLQRAMIQAKRSEEEVDFKLGWDKMDFGFTGIWHYKSVLNFQYVYKVFTPLDGFEENGLVLKNVYNSGLDTEFSLRISKHKFGVSILVRDKEQGLLKLIDDKVNHRNRKYTDQIIEDFSTDVYLTLNTLYYPTITFTAFLKKIEGENAEEIMTIKAELNLPNKTAIVLTDTFVLEDLTTMRNNLHLVTPFQILSEVKSVYTVDIILSEKYNVSMAADISNGTHWLKTSLYVFYEYDTGEDEEYAAHKASLHIATPLLVLPALVAEVGVHIEDAVTRMSADVEMPSFQITARGQIERDDTYIESVGSLNLTSPYLESYFISMNFKKDFSDIENSVACGLQVQQGEQNNYFFAESLWHPVTVNNLKFKFRGALETVMPPSEVSLNFRNEPKEKHRFIHVEGKIGLDDNFYLLNAEQKTGFTTLALKSPHNGFRNVNLTGEIKNNDDIVGFLNSDTVSYVIDGKITNKSPLEMTIALIPKGEGERHTLQVTYVTMPGQYSITVSMLETIQLTAHAKLVIYDQFTDVYFKVDTNHPTYKDIYLKTRLDFYPGNEGIFSIDAQTPLESIKHLKGKADMVIGPQSGYVKCSYNMTKMKGDGDLQWSFIWDNMYLKALGHQNITTKARSVDFKAFYGNSTEGANDISKAGFHMDLDKVWQIGANSTFGVIPNQKMDLTLNAFLPKPNVDVHTFLASYNNGHKEDLTKEVIVRYTTDVTKIIAGIDGQMLMLPNDFSGNASVKWGAASVVNSIDNRLYSVIKSNNSMAIDYKLITPLYAEEDTLDIKGSFEKILVDKVIFIEGVAACPQSNHIGDIDLRYGGLRKTAGNFNFTTPFQQLPWLKCNLNISNQEHLSENQIQAFWPNKSSTLNSTHKWYNDTKDSALGQEGVISMSVPLNTKHYISANYGYLQADRWSKGNATLTFNGKEYVEGAFSKVTEKSERDLDIDKMDIKIENIHTPLGIKYLHEYDEKGNIDVKQSTFYHLHNASRFNVTGKIDITAWETGKTLKLMAVHSNRTLTFENNYEAKDKDFLQGSKIKWAPDVWINYDIHVANKSHDDTESQEIVMNVWYPLKTFNLVALYHLQDTLLNGTAQLNWNIHGENKTSEVKGRWQNPTKIDSNIHDVDISLSHPSFRKDVNLKGFYSSDSSIMSNISIDLEYSEYQNEHLHLKSLLIDNSNGPSRDYKFDLFCKHPATNLDLEIRSDLNIQKRWYYFNSYYKYKKSLFYQTMKENKGLLDMKNALLKYERNTEADYFKLKGTWDMVYPDYKMNVNVNRTNGNDTGIALLSMKDRFVLAHFNRTDDVSYHLIGIINDARSAQLNAWRDFDDVKTVDVSSYIRLNHSRLLTSSILWRPDIYKELKGSIVMTFKDIYVNINETLMLMKSSPMETHMALKNVWNDAKPRIREFLDDLNDLHVIKYDLDEFQLYLNQSYYTNDFYVKDIVEFSYYIIDQMSIRNHLESLPDIVNEMWVIMGDTGTSMKASILWVIEYIKTSYSNFVENVNVVLNTDFMDQVSNLMESAIMKYDSFIKNLHLKLVSYWETTWTNAVTTIGATWKRLLKSMEPTVLKFVHYSETFVYKLSRELMDFFYARTNELTESPYFSLLSNLSQDLDRFWKDMKTNDAITNIQKYSKVAWNFINDKFLVHIPFRKELQEISMEIWNELNQLQELSVVKYAKAKFWEAKARLQWWYDYFLVSDALDKIVDILYKKASEIAKTALQNEETHRVPKTNFIFDPHKGQVILEQKLPMSWHGFNRTPDFTEISEYKIVHNILDQWILSNKTLWSYYYDVKPYLDMHNILPPFDGFAMMTGNGALVTFDRRVYTVSKTGTFVLVHDYKEDNFTVLMESNDLGRYNLVLLAKGQLIHIDMYREMVTIGQSVALTLPASVDDWILDREVDSVTAQNKYGLNIACNFLFKTCKIQIKGWYYASLGGLLGTMNNEQYDDQQLTSGEYTTSPEALADSWNIEQEETRSTAPIQNRETQNDTLCEKFFENKVSPLHPCFSMIDAMPFFKECLSGVDPCTLANSYLELCGSDQVSIHIPEQCVQCTSPQGEPIEEGYVYELPKIPHSTDVVFIVEAEFCNVNIRKSKNIDVLISALDGKLLENGLTDNRYGIIIFGGSGLYKKPRSLYVNNRLFSPPSEIPEHFDSIYIEKQDMDANKTHPADMFGALSYASSLPFRPGVSRTFIMLPCTRCDMLHMKLDYSVVHQVLLDSSVTLHILMNDEFSMSKKRVMKNLYGVDSHLAYSTKDTRRLVGDSELRKQVKLPKAKLGFCTSLAIETNGTIFTARKLAGERAGARRLSGVFGGRVAQSARPCTARPTRCECHTARLHCAPCLLRHRLVGDVSSALWASDEMDDMFDNILDINLPLMN